MSLKVIRIGSNRGAKGFHGSGVIARSKLIHPAMAEFFGSCIRFTHDIH